MTWTPDPSFYPSPRMASKAPAETLAYVAAFDPDRKTPDAIAVVDVDTNSKSYSQIVGQVDMPNTGDELHHFGWNACSSCLCPNAPHPHVERRYLIVPGLRSSRLHIIDTKNDPRNPKIVRVIEPEEIAEKAGYSRLHTTHCGPEGIYVNALGDANGNRPGGNRLKKYWRKMTKPRSGISKDGFIRYYARKGDCSSCALKPQCTPNQPARKIARHIYEGARDLAREIAATDAYVDMQRRRKKVEMLFAHLKRILKLDRLRLRGPNGAKDEFHLAATAQNLRKLAKLSPQPA